ncbi:cytochrome P450 [Striga asiatica]|uniref:Cytochrome P450 n=1 Tax=Striga asiatica TaxID=4170 RepID=A0A5A7R7A6_STRAF|nr:cytochrome P450 [Striga asiatica]
MGYDIFPGTTVVINTWATGRDNPENLFPRVLHNTQSINLRFVNGIGWPVAEWWQPGRSTDEELTTAEFGGSPTPELVMEGLIGRPALMPYWSFDILMKLDKSITYNKQRSLSNRIPYQNGKT